jgi:hypothetical protein
MGTLTSHVENQNPHGLTPAESQLSQPTRKMGNPATNLRQLKSSREGPDFQSCRNASRTVEERPFRAASGPDHEYGLQPLSGCPILRFASAGKREPVPHFSRVLCARSGDFRQSEAEGLGTWTSHAENQTPNGLTLLETHLSQQTRKMAHPAMRTENVRKEKCGTDTPVRRL